jgi:DNA polymerase-3 subunit epsilon
VFAFIWRVQLSLDALDRLVDLLEERGAMSTVDAARALFATPSISDGLACSLLAEVTFGDSRVVCTGATVSLAGTRTDPLLENAEFVVFDLETTGLSAVRDRICEFGAVRIRGLELVDSFQTLVNPGVKLPGPVVRITGLRDEELKDAPPLSSALPRFLRFAGDDLLVAHNARFDQRFVDRQLLRRHGRRLSEPPLCTAALARRVLQGRARRVGLASLAHFFGVPTTPCHRALPDAEATAQILVHLIGLAQELGARRLSELRALAAPRKRRVYGKRALAHGAPTRPGVYLFRDRHDQVLYVGRARDLRARLRSYFRSERQRPSVEAALLALERIEWRVLGSELEAALEELRLIRELSPPANSRGRRKEHGVYLRRRGEDFVVSKTAKGFGPIPSRRRAALAARALSSATPEELDALLDGGPLPRLRARLARLADELRYEEAARLRDRIDALEHVVARLNRLEGLRRLELCLIAPAAEPGWRKAFFVSCGGVSVVRSIPPGGGARLELGAGLAAARAARDETEEPLTPEQAEDLMLLHGFVRRPPPELAVLPLDARVLAREAQRNHGGRVGHLAQDPEVDVRHGVAGLVVAGVVGPAGGAPEALGGVLSLDLVGAGEDPADREASPFEGGVVGAAAEQELLDG